MKRTSHVTHSAGPGWREIEFNHHSFIQSHTSTTQVPLTDPLRPWENLLKKEIKLFFVSCFVLALLSVASIVSGTFFWFLSFNLQLFFFLFFYCQRLIRPMITLWFQSFFNLNHTRCHISAYATAESPAVVARSLAKKSKKQTATARHGVWCEEIELVHMPVKQLRRILPE